VLNVAGLGAGAGGGGGADALEGAGGGGGGAPSRRGGGAAASSLSRLPQRPLLAYTEAAQRVGDEARVWRDVTAHPWWTWLHQRVILRPHPPALASRAPVSRRRARSVGAEAARAAANATLAKPQRGEVCGQGHGYFRVRWLNGAL
jgi:hypothetical protein